MLLHLRLVLHLALICVTFKVCITFSVVITFSVDTGVVGVFPLSLQLEVVSYGRRIVQVLAGSVIWLVLA